LQTKEERAKDKETKGRRGKKNPKPKYIGLHFSFNSTTKTGISVITH
jgi:hypothetical protein